MLEAQERAVRDLLGAPGGATVLDVGGGHGQLALPLAAAGWRVTVLGSDPVCARRIAPAVAAGRVQFVAGDVLALPFPDRAFDFVVSVRLLPHCERWPALVAERAIGERQREEVAGHELHTAGGDGGRDATHADGRAAEHRDAPAPRSERQRQLTVPAAHTVAPPGAPSRSRTARSCAWSIQAPTAPEKREA